MFMLTEFNLYQTKRHKTDLRSVILRVAKLRVARCELRGASCEVRVVSCELRVASCELRVASCELRVASDKDWR